MDDDLNDILSDESDSFFFADVKPKKSIDKGKEKSSILSERIPTSKDIDDGWLGLKDTKAKDATNYETTALTSTAVKDDEDELPDMGWKSEKQTTIKDIFKKPEEPKKSKPLSYTDILDGSSFRKDEAVKPNVQSSTENIFTVSSSQSIRQRGSLSTIVTKSNESLTSYNPTGRKDSLTNTAAKSAEVLNTYSPSGSRRNSISNIVPKSNEALNAYVNKNVDVSGVSSFALSRRPRTTTNKIDPLGFLEPQPKDPIVQDPPKKTETNEMVTKSKGSVPNWLLGAGEKVQENDTSKTVDPQVTVDVVDTKTVVESVAPAMETLLNQQKMSSSHMELQNATVALQQQESQLMIALQLKKYEENLAAMQRAQQDILAKQEAQFNSLLEKQFSKQQLMETNMRSTQERINNHIQLLLTQAPTTSVNVTENDSKVTTLINETINDNHKFYEDIISSLKQKHQEEILLLEESYKKQLSLLESNLESTEMRLKTEIDSTTKYYTQKLSEIATEKEDIINKYNTKINNLNEEYETEITKLKERHNIIVDDVRMEYKNIIDDLKRSKQREMELMTDAGLYTQKLNESVAAIQDNNNKIDEIQMKMKSEHTVVVDLKTEALNAKEREVKLMSESLEKQRAILENERTQLMTLVRTLEGRLVEQTQAAREERWCLQQAVATFSARSQALDRESEILNANLERERQHLKMAKEDFVAEKEKLFLELSEQKLQIASEKSRYETTHKLNENYDLNKAKLEVEAALQVARDAAELTDKERENLYRQQRELELLKRSLTTKEQKLISREQEIEYRLREADQKYKEGEKALSQAHVMESSFTASYNEMKKQMLSLAAREKKLTEEKVELSKERIMVHNSMKDIKKCGLCKADVYSEKEYKFSENYVEHDKPRFYNEADLELLRLKQEIENDSVTSQPSVINHMDLN